MTIHSGVEQFSKNVYPGMREHFEGLADGQSPSVLFITCSDSRIDPALVTQSKPGDMFVLRNVGNLVPSYGTDTSSASVIEYAVSALGVSRIVVCGHSGCGAMHALLHPETAASLPSVSTWVEQAAPVRGRVADVPEEGRWPAAIQANVRYQLELLAEHPSVAKAVAAGGLTLEGWVYDIGKGQVERL